MLKNSTVNNNKEEIGVTKNGYSFLGPELKSPESKRPASNRPESSFSGIPAKIHFRRTLFAFSVTLNRNFEKFLKIIS